MGKEGLMIYSFVARGTTVVAEYTEFTGNFPKIAEKCLQGLPANNNKFVYNCDHHSFNFLLHNGYAYCVVAKESVSNKVCIAFLERVKEDFIKTYGGGKADTAMAKSLTKNFGPVMKEHMRYVVEHIAEIDKVAQLKDQVAELKNIMQENITLVIDRGEDLTNLEEKTAYLRDSAQTYKGVTTQIQRKMWYQNMKVKLIVIGILLMLALVIWLSVCRGFNCSD